MYWIADSVAASGVEHGWTKRSTSGQTPTLAMLGAAALCSLAILMAWHGDSLLFDHEGRVV